MKNSAIWIYVVGIFMFIWGFCQMGYAFMGFDLPITIPYTEWGNLLGEDELFSDVQLGLAFSCMLTGVGLLIFRAWARVFTIWIRNKPECIGLEIPLLTSLTTIAVMGSDGLSTVEY